MPEIKTSITHPLYTTIIDDDLPGTVSLTIAPGKHCHALFAGGEWQRDVVTDLDRLVETYNIGLLVCLLEDHELESLKIPHLITEAEQRMEVLRLPIKDRDVSDDLDAVRDLVDAIEDAATAGVDVVIHCRGGLGRAGTIGGCYLRQRGYSDDEIFARLATRDADNCPETEAQRAFIRAFPVDLPPEETAPAAMSMPSSPPRSTTSATSSSYADRVAGAVLAAAIGDAIGHPTEFMSMDAIRKRYGDSGVTGFELWWTRNGQTFAPYTDDTQMSEAVIAGILHSAENDLDVDGMMNDLAARFIAWADDPQGGHRAPGNACLAGCRALSRGVPWSEAGGPTAGGCGSVMRAWPFGLRFVDDLDHAEFLAVEHSKLTHRDPIALAACAAVARGIALCVRGASVDDVVADMIAAAARYSVGTADMIARAVDEARAGVLPSVTLDRLRAWAAHEAIAGAVYVFVRHADDVRAGILEGANTPGDSDSLASIAGALIGARSGISAVPADWVSGVERSLELLALAADLAR